MSDGFAGCESCGRHVRARDAVCPFCQTILSTAPIPIADGPGGRVSRAAIFAGASLIIAGCTPQRDQAAPIYGGPPPMEADAAVVAPDLTSTIDAAAAVATPDAAISDASTLDASSVPDARAAKPKPQAPVAAPMYGLAPHHDPQHGPTQ